MQHFCFGICMHNFFLETHKLHVTFTNEILKNSRKKNVQHMYYLSIMIKYGQG